MKRFSLLALVLSSCSTTTPLPKVYTPKAVVPQPVPARMDCQIGPWLGEINYSANMPLHPVDDGNGAYHFDFGLGAQPHYITCPTESLAGKTQIRARFRISGDPATTIFGVKCDPTTPGSLTLYFEEKDVKWSKDGYRWWAKPLRVRPLVVNSEFEVVASLKTTRWWSVSTINSVDNPDVFSRGKLNAARLGFTLGNCTGSGHGIDATGVARLSVLELVAE